MRHRTVFAQVRMIALSTLLCLATVMGYQNIAYACIPTQQSCSAGSIGYGVGQIFFGGGGALCDPTNVDQTQSEHSTGSTGYCAKIAVGETGVGFIGSTSGGLYQAQAGFNTDREPSLTFCVYKTSCGDSPALNVGTLNAGSTATGTVQFSVKTYLASGYQVVTYGAAPTNGSYTLSALTTPTAANSAAEQFGINLVANNSCGGGMPGSLGAAAVQIPDSTFSFGAAAHTSGTDYYDTACQFMYKNGDTIATSNKSSGETDFTISYIFNTTNLTRGGTYTMTQSLVATSTF